MPGGRACAIVGVQMTAQAHTATIFDHVLCGVDRTEAGIAAARVAGRIVASDGTLTLVSANDPSIAVHAGWSMPQVLEEVAADAAALELARAEAEPHHPVDARLIEGDPRRGLLAEIAREGATTVVVGGHGGSRAAGIALGAVSTALLHEAPCAVLIARGDVASDWPRRIVVGIDGSDGSAQAFDAATVLAARLGATVRSIVATAGGHADLEGARRIAPDCEEHDADALVALGVASETADLVVVGSRGLRGIRALGSVGERIAHGSRCAVLVVRQGVEATIEQGGTR